MDPVRENGPERKKVHGHTFVEKTSGRGFEGERSAGSQFFQIEALWSSLPEMAWKGTGSPEDQSVPGSHPFYHGGFVDGMTGLSQGRNDQGAKGVGLRRGKFVKIKSGSVDILMKVDKKVDGPASVVVHQKSDLGGRGRRPESSVQIHSFTVGSMSQVKSCWIDEGDDFDMTAFELRPVVREGFQKGKNRVWSCWLISVDSGRNEDSRGLSFDLSRKGQDRDLCARHIDLPKDSRPEA